MTVPITDLTDWNELAYEVYDTLEEKIQALLNGEVIYIKSYEVNTGTSVLARMVTERGVKLAQITYDIYNKNEADRYWINFNIGINDLSLFDVYKVTDASIFLKPNKFKVGDIVGYDSVDGHYDTAVVLAIYENKTKENDFSYKLSREPDVLYEEHLLISNKFKF